MSCGRVLFVGCGPGAADLLTLRAVAALQAADVVVWNSSLLDRETVASHARADAEIVQWPPATSQDILDVFARALADDLVVARLKGGDPTLFGRMEPELSAARRLGLACEIVPGISAFAASAAACGCEIATTNEPLLLIDAGALAEPQPATHRLAVYGVTGDPRAVQQALLHRGLGETTPCVVAIETSRRAEMLVPCLLGELAETIEDMGLGVLTLVLAGTPVPGSPARRTGRKN